MNRASGLELRLAEPYGEAGGADCFLYREAP